MHDAVSQDTWCNIQYNMYVNRIAVLYLTELLLIWSLLNLSVVIKTGLVGTAVKT